MSNKFQNFRNVTFAIVCFLSLIPVYGQLNIEERNEIRTEIASALENYHHIFSTGTPSEIANNIYGSPLVSVSINGDTTVWSTNAEVEAMVSSLLTDIRAQGWFRSSMPSPNICVLGPNSGFASGQFIRYQEDGSELSRSGMAYVFQRKSEGWKMTTFLAHESNVKIECME